MPVKVPAFSLLNYFTTKKLNPLGKPIITIRTTFYAYAFAGLMTITAYAQAAIIDFNGLSGCGNGFCVRGSLYVEDGFKLEGVDNSILNSYHLTANPSFLNSTIDAETRLTQIGGGAFSLVSIDLDTLQTNLPVSVTFTGSLAGGGLVSQSFTTDSAAGTTFETFNFGTNFSNVIQVDWTQISPFHKFDNIVVNQAPVPLPGGLWLLVSGLAGLVVAGWRKTLA
jgi:hypothetical protein